MKRSFKLLLAGVTVAGSIALCTAAYGKFSDSVTVTNHISTGDVNISLKELEKKDGREMAYQDRRIILPGDEISKIPRITNQSEPCWVRVKISYTDDLEGMEGLNDSNLKGMSPRWIRKGEYFYYTRKLEQGESADVFTSVAVPDQWNEAYHDKSFGITIVADAIQAANFAPDFSAMSPWGNQKIQRCVHDTDGLVVQKKNPVNLKVEFEGNAHKLIAAPEDFFAGFSTAMPGDVFQDSVEISNTTENTAEIFFRTSPECKSVKDQEFLKKLKLVIAMDGKKLYSGNLLAASLNKAVSLGAFSSGKGGKMQFQITVPAELDNAYALRETDVKWIFSVEEDENIKSSPAPRRQKNSGYMEKEKHGNSTVSGKAAPVKTGDETNIFLFLFLGGMALLAGGMAFWKGGRKN